MPKSFAEDLADAKAAFFDDPADAVVSACQEFYGITIDPVGEVGIKGEWDRYPEAIDVAIRVMVQGFGMFQKDAAARMGYTPGRAHNAKRPPSLDEHEMQIFGMADDRYKETA